MTKNKNKKQVSNGSKQSKGQKAKPRFVLDVKPFSVGPVESKGFHLASGRSVGMSIPSSRKPIMGHEEPLSDVNSSVNLVILTFALQLGLASIFPRGSKEASAFQNYVMRRLRVNYIPDVSAFADGGQQGKVYLGYSPNASAVLPDGVEGLQLLPAARNALASKGFSLNCDEALSHRGLMIRQGIVPGGSSVNDYDSGTVFVAVEGSTGGGIKLGRVTLSYEAEAWHPVIGDSLEATLNTTCADLESPDTTVTSAATTIMPLVVTHPGLGVSATAGVVSLLPGRYQVSVTAQVSAGTSVNLLDLALYLDASVLRSHRRNGVPISTDTMSFTVPVTITGTEVLDLRLRADGTGVLTAAVSMFIRTC